MRVKSYLASILLLSLALSAVADYNANSYCVLAANGTRLASLEFCNVYYLCVEGKAIQSECPDGQWFDRNAVIGQQRGVCLNSKDVKCNLEDPCHGSSEIYVAKRDSCTDFYYCQDNTLKGEGSCPKNTVFDKGQCIHGVCDLADNSDDQIIVNDPCDIWPENQFFGASDDCTKWQVCRSDGLKSGNCPTDQVFFLDKAEGYCRISTATTCDRLGSGAIIDTGDGGPCNVEGNYKSDPKRCTAYLQCVNLKWVRKPCDPAGTYYEPVSGEDQTDGSADIGRCEDRSKAVPVATCNRCEGTTYDFVNQVGNDCEKYIICDGKGNMVAKQDLDAQKCLGVDSYFDEKLKACFQNDNNNRKANYIASNLFCAGP